MNMNCRTCEQPFPFSEEEQQILRDTSPKYGGVCYEIPAPKDCGECRAKVLSQFHNDANLYKNTCIGSQKELLAGYSPESWAKVMDYELWFSDAFNPLDHGRDIDFSKTFFEQFRDLVREVPRLNISVNNLENSPYVNAAGYIKNSYLLFNASHDENCLYSYGIFNCKDSSDMSYSKEMELCYECVDSEGCYQSSYIQDSKQCRDSYFLFDCRNCTNCIGSWGLRNKENYIFNKPASKEEVETMKKKIQAMNWREIQEFSQKFQDHVGKYPRKHLLGEGNEDVSGNYLDNCTNVYRSYAMRDAENCYDCSSSHTIKDAISVIQWGERSDHLYYCMEVGGDANHVALSNLVWMGVSYMYYSDMCFASNNCFGSVGLKKNQYCILNKQYTKEEYEDVVPKIIAHMKSTGEWGEYFPLDCSPFAYNESNAQQLYPLTLDEIKGKGLTYREEHVTKATTCDIVEDTAITDVNSTIIEKVLCSEISAKPYRIIPQEYAFYLRRGIPIPREHYMERMVKRQSRRTPERLFIRNCEQCTVSLETSYEQEKVLCEGCYLESIV